MLPVETCWPALEKEIEAQDVILVAPPGAGKSTYLPLKLLQHPKFAAQKIIMLQPRQIAVTSIAVYLSEQLGEPVGQTIGYRMRGESKVSANTRLEIVTEGLLTRLLQNDPELANVGLIIFDEFHERNIHSDFALALCLEVKQAIRDDLRLLVMSATLDAAAVAKLLPDAKQLESLGRSFPVTSHYRPRTKSPLEQDVFQVIREAVDSHEGDLLVFLPGARQIVATQQLCTDYFAKYHAPEIETHTLFGQLDKHKQRLAIQPAKQGRRKIVLATNIAETSLTIDGIKVVIDSGLENVANFNWQRRIQQLSMKQISKASATQRAGRAGRLSPGDCYRLWSKETQQRLIAQRAPEILETDISGLYLDAKVWGSELSELPLLDHPTSSQLDYAKSVLLLLGAIDSSSKLTAHGRALNSFGCHPRLAGLLVHSQQGDGFQKTLACLLVALLEFRPINELRRETELRQHLVFLISNPSHPIWVQGKRWAKRIGCSCDSRSLNLEKGKLSQLLSSAYPDQIARLRDNGAYQLVNGTGAKYYNPNGQAAAMLSKWIIVTKLTVSEQADAFIQLAEPIDEALVFELFKDHFEQQCEYTWSQSLNKVVAREKQSFGAIVLREKQIEAVDPAKCVEIVLDQIRQQGLSFLNWQDRIWTFIHRVSLARKVEGDCWPDFSEPTLLAELERWLQPFLDGIVSATKLQQLDWLTILKTRLTWEQQQHLQKYYPVKIKDATGQECKLVYSADGQVEMQVKMQQMYGYDSSPSVANGKVPITLTLLSPAGRPLQKTQDLTGFWQGSYAHVQKEMKGRYPKHFWPDNPATAQATTRVKKYM
ncbi:MAG: ATP-dependent helicase HrpB [Aliiglaciecola sp.]|uniref:ATP-dependent helicase HrpB n=1 Tax=Aliiglaciecola sp. TaxID=1872441 RepID=UPI0032968C6C